MCCLCIVLFLSVTCSMSYLSEHCRLLVICNVQLLIAMHGRTVSPKSTKSPRSSPKSVSPKSTKSPGSSPKSPQSPRFLDSPPPLPSHPPLPWCPCPHSPGSPCSFGWLDSEKKLAMREKAYKMIRYTMGDAGAFDD